MLSEGLPIKRIKNNIPGNTEETVPVSLYGQTEGINRKLDKVASELMSGVSYPKDNKGAEQPMTPIDLPPLQLKTGGVSIGKELLKWAKRIMEEDKETSESNDNVYKRLDSAYQKAKIFLENTLEYKGVIKDKKLPRNLNSEEELMKLLEKTKIAQGDSQGLSQALKYCRIVKATIATFETTKHHALFLDEITDIFENSLISKKDEDEAPLKRVGYHKDGVEFLVQDDDGSLVNGIFDSRSKKFKGVVLRYLTRPESSAEVALEDGIGVRIIIDPEQSLVLVPILFEHFIKKMNMDTVTVENGGYLTSTQEVKLEKRLSNKFSGAQDSFSLVMNKPNKTSGGNFKSLRMKGMLVFPDKNLIKDEKGNTVNGYDLSSHAKRFEIQFVDPENENEKGGNNHAVYDIKKLITARTRLDGWCPKKVFDEFVHEATETGMTSEEICGFLLGTHLENPSTKKRIAKKAPIVEMEINGRLVYLAFSVYERWKKLGFISAEFFAKIEASRKYLDLDPIKPKEKN